jgi:ribosomal protein S18 acetylase RimI-like enzyme
MIQIEKYTEENFSSVRAIAQEVWPVAYGAILSEAQLAYMMDLMYSIPSLQKQVNEKQHHFIIAKEKQEPQGFASFEFNYEGIPTTKIHKIYIYTHQQGKGIGKQLINYVANEAKKAQQNSLSLNVNRNNSALNFYQRLGFTVVNEVDIAIGNGYLMEDYVMEKPI